MSGGRLLGLDLPGEHRAADLDTEPFTKAGRCLIPATLAGDESFDRLRDPLGLEARPALVDVLLQARAAGLVALVVEHDPYIRYDR